MHAVARNLHTQDIVASLFLQFDTLAKTAPMPPCAWYANAVRTMSNAPYPLPGKPSFNENVLQLVKEKLAR